MFTVMLYDRQQDEVSVLPPAERSNGDMHHVLAEQLMYYTTTHYLIGRIPEEIYKTMWQYNELEGFLVFSRPGDWLEIKYDGALVARFIHVKPPRVRPWNQRMVLHGTK